MPRSRLAGALILLLALSSAPTAGATGGRELRLALTQEPPSTFFVPAALGGPFYGGKTDVALSAFVKAVADPTGIAVNSADHIPARSRHRER